LSVQTIFVGTDKDAGTERNVAKIGPIRRWDRPAEARGAPKRHSAFTKTEYADPVETKICTLRQRNFHARSGRTHYSELTMRGAFVVRVRNARPGTGLEGSAEEVDTGKHTKFLSEDELIEFLRARYLQALETDQGSAEVKFPATRKTETL
jgi:hypothetical protein